MRTIVLESDVSDETLTEMFSNDGLIEDVKVIRDGHAERFSAPGRFVIFKDVNLNKIIVQLAVPLQQLN